MIKIAILGYGVVGSALAKLLIENKNIIQARCGKEIVPVIALARSKKPNALISVTQSVDEILKRDDIDIFVELMGGVDEAFKIVCEILKKKKPVVSANKAMLAYHRYELEELANSNNTSFGFEASVAGGIPIIKVLKEGLSANHILGIKGILNGTCNYILSNMSEFGSDFESTLKKAQELGYAEADPSFDVSGKDAAHKLLILASLAYNLKAVPEDILIEGIEEISADDIKFAKDFNFSIKLLGIAHANDEKIELRVHPALISNSNLIAKVNGVMNAVSISGDMLNESLYYGPGAGGAATASAVVSDLMELARGKSLSPMLGFKQNVKYSLLKKDEIYAKYYLRIKVEDKIGVLSKITNLMSENQISIDSFLQKPKINEAYSTLFFTTHHTYEKSVQNLLNKLQKQDFIKAKPFMMRIE